MGRLITLSPDQLLPPIAPMREDVDQTELAELADSIKRHGLRQPLLVAPEGPKWRIVAGHRRWLACQLAGLVEIPCIEESLEAVDQVVAMVEENLHRAGVNPLEEARVFHIIRDARDLTLEGLAKLIGKSASYVAARMQLLEAPADVQEALRQGLISMSVAHQLARLVHDDDRAFYLAYSLNGGATTDTVRRWVDEAIARRQLAPTAPVPSAADVSLPAPEPVKVTCEWCHHQVLWERTVTLRVCWDCGTFLQQVHDEVNRKAQEPGPAAPAPGDSRPGEG